MKKALFYLFALTITLSCKTKSDLTVENFESPQVEQKMQKSYGSGGKIIYGVSEGSQNDSPSYSHNFNEENNQTPLLEKEVDKSTHKKNRVKSPKKKGFGFSAFKMRPFSKKVKKTSTKPTNARNSKSDNFAITGFVMPLAAVAATLLLIVLAYAGGEFLVLALVLAVILLLILGIIFSIAGLKSERFKGLAITGLILSILGILFIALIFIGYAVGY